MTSTEISASENLSNEHTVSISTEDQTDTGDKTSDDEDEKNNSIDDLADDEETRVCK